MDYLKTDEGTENKKRLQRRKSMLMSKVFLMSAGIILIVGLLAGCGEPEPTKELYNTKDYIEGYYQGNVDRVSTKTVVYVIGPQDEKLLLRKTIGVNSPGDVTSTPTGQVMHDQAKDYIAQLFED